jgi:hypothetical protein
VIEERLPYLEELIFNVGELVLLIEERLPNLGELVSNVGEPILNVGWGSPTSTSWSSTLGSWCS